MEVMADKSKLRRLGWFFDRMDEGMDGMAARLTNRFFLRLFYP